MTFWKPPIDFVDPTPTGAVIAYISDSIPDNWLLLNADTIGNDASAAIQKGSELRDLFDIVKDLPPNTGAEDFDSADTVILPDIRQKFILGRSAAGTGSTLGGSGGAIDHTHSIGSHVHTLGSHQHESPLSAVASNLVVGAPFGLGTTRAFTRQSVAASLGSNAQTSLTSAATGNTGTATGNTGTNNPPFIALNYIIKI